MNIILSEYYKIDIIDYKTYNDGIIFFINDSYYYFFKCDYDEEYLEYIFNIVSNIKIKLHSFVFNKHNMILSDGYVLIKLNYLINKIDFIDLQKFNIKVDSNEKYDFINNWRNKIDYLENKVFDLNDKVIIYSFDYYSGIVEMVLSYFKNIKYNGELYLCHKKFSMNSIDFYNPVNITFDIYLRDIASYIIYNKKIDLLYEKLIYLNDYERLYLFSRLVLPFDYFYLLEDIINGLDKKRELEKYIESKNYYELYIKKIESIFKINIFKWIKKE